MTVRPGRWQIGSTLRGSVLALAVLVAGWLSFANLHGAQDAGSPTLGTSIQKAETQTLSAHTGGQHVPSSPVPVYSAAGNAGLTIIPTFDASVDVPTRAVIQNAINFYQQTFSNPITVNIEFHNMGSGLGSSFFVYYNLSYSSYRAALAAGATSPDDVTAIANTPSGATNPINGSANLGVKSANGRALGLSTPEFTFSSGCFSGGPSFTGSGCIGINVTLANTLGNMTAVVQHEIDEVLGLGSALQGGVGAPTNPWPHDLFRWASTGVRSYAANPATGNPCAATPNAFFSIDGGATNLNQFNNCNNGGDYGDWITHTPSQVQDAFTNGSAAPFVTVTSSEVRALDVIGYTIGLRSNRDFNSSGTSDILWRNTSGQVYEWLIDGTSRIGAGSPGSATSDWQIAGTGDFQGDRSADILWRNSTSGQVYEWFMNGTSVILQGSPGTVSTDWTIARVADFDGNGKSDILWRNSTSGLVYIWLMDGLAKVGEGSPGSATSDWAIVGTGDFDGNGKSDVLWRQTSTGLVWEWLMNGTGVASQGSPGGATSDWTIAGVGDFNGDARSDVLWRQTSTGLVWEWLLNGLTQIGAGSPGGATSDWQIVATGDYNGDTRSDVLWRQTSTGLVWEWLLNGTSQIGAGSPGGATSDWVIQP